MTVPSSKDYDRLAASEDVPSVTTTTHGESFHDEDDEVEETDTETERQQQQPRSTKYCNKEETETESKQLVVQIPPGGEEGEGGTEEDDAVVVTSTITVDDAIEQLGMGLFQYLVLVAAGLCFAADAMQILLLSFLCKVLEVEWGLSEDGQSSLTSALFAGAMVGTLLIGPFADVKGRRPAFFVASSMISVFGIAVGFAVGYLTALAAIFMVGVGVGGLTVPFDILAEFVPSNSRGRNLLLIEYFWTIGALLVVCVADFALGHEHDNWRLFVVLCSIPCCFSILCGYFFVPESPRWLCTQGKCDEALDIIRNAAKTNGLDVDTIFPLGMQLAAEDEEHADFTLLFTPRWRWITLKLWGAWGAFAFGYYGTILAITMIFESDKADDPSSSSSSSSSSALLVTTNDTDPNVSFDYGAIFVSSSAELIGTTFVILAVDSAGRIPVQVVSYALAGICVCTLCVMAAHDAPRQLLIVLGFVARIFEMAGSCVSWVSTAEILTTEVRTTGHGAANAVARLGALVCPFFVEKKTPLIRLGVVMLVVHCVTVLCVSTLPETKGGHMGGGTATDVDLDDASVDDDREAPPTTVDGHSPSRTVPLIT